MLFLFAVVTVTYAAPVRIPSNAGKTEGVLKEFAEGKVVLGIDAQYESVDKVKMDKENGKIDFDTASGIISLTYDSRFALYSSFGQAMDPKYKASDATDNWQYNLEDSFVWGLGANAVISDIEGWQVFSDVNYRKLDDMDYESVVINGTTISKSSLGGKMDVSWEEWQIALGVAKAFDIAKPYFGVKYLKAESSGKITYSGTTYDMGSAKNDNPVGVFAGIEFNPTPGISIDVQGRFIDETAITAGFSFKF